MSNAVIYEARQSQLAAMESTIPQMHQRALYIGAKVDRDRLPFGLDFVRRHAEKVVCWEIWKTNADAVWRTGWFDDVVCRDVRLVNACLDVLRDTDLIFWWHGPEHLQFAEAVQTLSTLSTARTTIVGCPWGRYVQGNVKGNPHESHLCRLYPEDFDRLRFKVSTTGRVDARGSNILAWRSA